MFRDYDPSLGIYKQSDPIGLRGGLNTYVYVGADPLRYTDPKGEAIPVAVAACLANPACVSLVTVTIAAAANAIVQTINAINNSSSSSSSGASPSSTTSSQCKDPCQEPNAPYDLLNGRGDAIGTILYKDIPLGWFILPPKTAGKCGSVFADDHVTGGSWGDYQGGFPPKSGGSR